MSQPEIAVVTGRMYSWQPGQMQCQASWKDLKQLDGPTQAHNSLYSTKTSSFLKQGSLPSARAIGCSHPQTETKAGVIKPKMMKTPQAGGSACSQGSSAKFDSCSCNQSLLRTGGQASQQLGRKPVQI